MALRNIREALSTFLSKRDSGERQHLTRLWEHWEMVMGQDLASLGSPLGHRKDTLIIAAEDPMAAQDLIMQVQEILERANAFMDSPYFTRVQVEQNMGRRNLAKTERPVIQRSEFRLPKPHDLGKLTGVLDPNSPVGQCYAAYLRYFARPGS